MTGKHGVDGLDFDGPDGHVGLEGLDRLGGLEGPIEVRGRHVVDPAVLRARGARMRWTSRMAAQGGIARARELRGWHLSDVDIRMFASYGLLIPVRQGWYALVGTAPAVVDACRSGGRLACVSALAHHGIVVPSDGRLHIEIPGNAVRRSAGDSALVRMHWARRRSDGDRAAVSADAAVRQALACVACPPL